MKKYFEHLKETLLGLTTFGLVMVTIISPCASIAVALMYGTWWLIPCAIIVDVALIPLISILDEKLERMLRWK